MEYRTLGDSGVKVSAICLGTMMFGDRTDSAVAGEIVASARAAGINFIDTADVYAKGESERITGQLIRANRSDWVVASKVGNPVSEAANEGGLSRIWMARALDATLARLNTDYIDIYYFHREDPGVRLRESLRAVGDFIRAGKVRYFGLSNFRGWRIAEVVRLCDLMNMPRPICVQPHYNAMNRMAEVEILPACHYYGLGVVPYSPLARGVLTGKYQADAPPPEGSRAARADKRMMETEFRPESMELVRRIQRHAEARGTTAAHFAIAWVLANEMVSSVIVGPRTLEQWQDYLAGLAFRFDSGDEALLDALVQPGHPSSPGFSDPSHPFFGRTRSGNPVRDS